MTNNTFNYINNTNLVKVKQVSNTAKITKKTTLPWPLKSIQW